MMDMTPPTPEQGQYALRALMTVAMADGELHEQEHRMIRLFGEMLGLEVDVRDVAPITPEELAEHLDGVETRHAFVRWLVILTTMDGEVTDDETERVSEYARALGVQERAIRDLRLLAAGHVRRAAFDIGRRSFAPQLLGKVWRERGVRALWELVSAATGVGGADVKARFEALGGLPEGTLGHALYHQFVDNEFPIPGEKGGAPDYLLFHDLGHVIAGYGTTPDQELLVAGFQAGYMNVDGLAMYLMIAMLFQLSVEPVAKLRGVEPRRGALDIDRFMTAVARGRSLNVDLIEWDPWPHMDRPLDDVRAELGIVV
jgi:uncharacterized tellurite resistance protein B-like protein